MMKEFPTERVSQLEALKIDNECKDLLNESLTKSFELISGDFVNKWSAELKLLVDFIYFRETVSKDANLPGSHLQNVQFSSNDNEKLSVRRKVRFFLVSVLGSYSINKISAYLAQNHKQVEDGGHKNYKRIFKMMKRLMDVGEKVYKLANLMNFVSFLISGKYRSIPERICGISMKCVDPNTVRFLDFELQNRTIIWGIISDFMQFLLPLANDLSIFQSISKVLFFTTFLGSISSESPASEIEDSKCGICDEIHITMPRQINNCKHLFCYYCIQQHLHAKAGQNITCPQCNALFDTLIPLKP